MPNHPSPCRQRWRRISPPVLDPSVRTNPPTCIHRRCWLRNHPQREQLEPPTFPTGSGTAFCLPLAVGRDGPQPVSLGKQEGFGGGVVPPDPVLRWIRRSEGGHSQAVHTIRAGNRVSGKQNRRFGISPSPPPSGSPLPFPHFPSPSPPPPVHHHDCCRHQCHSIPRNVQHSIALGHGGRRGVTRAGCEEGAEWR